MGAILNEGNEEAFTRNSLSVMWQWHMNTIVMMLLSLTKRNETLQQGKSHKARICCIEVKNVMCGFLTIQLDKHEKCVISQPPLMIDH